jgi:hypothetical protein
MRSAGKSFTLFFQSRALKTEIAFFRIDLTFVNEASFFSAGVEENSSCCSVAKLIGAQRKAPLF